MDECGSILQLDPTDPAHGLGVENRRMNLRSFMGFWFADPLKPE